MYEGRPTFLRKGILIMKKLVIAFGALVLVAACQKGGGAGGPSAASPTTEDEKTLYALGQMVGRQLPTLKLNPQELAMVQRGIGDAASGAKSEIDMQQYGPKVQAFAKGRTNAAAAAASAEQKQKDEPYLAAAEKEAGAQKTQSGMVYKELTAGTGESPKATDRVKVNYEGKLSNGTVFDSSYQRGQPATFGLNGVIPCWTEGVQKMKVGGTSQLVCPSTIAYGDMGHPPTIPGGAVLTFKVELVSIEPPAPQPPPGMGGMPMPGMNGMPAGMNGMPGGHPMPITMPPAAGGAAHPMPPTPPPAAPAAPAAPVKK